MKMTSQQDDWNRHTPKTTPRPIQMIHNREIIHEITKRTRMQKKTQLPAPSHHSSLTNKHGTGDDIPETGTLHSELAVKRQHAIHIDTQQTTQLNRSTMSHSLLSWRPKTNRHQRSVARTRHENHHPSLQNPQTTRPNQPETQRYAYRSLPNETQRRNNPKHNDSHIGAFQMQQGDVSITQS